MKYLILLGILATAWAGTFTVEESILACGDATRPAYVTMDENDAGLLFQEGYNYSMGALYEPNMLCDWHVHSIDGTQIELKFLEFVLEDSEQCKADAVTVWEGDHAGTSEEAEAILCGQIIPDTILFDENVTEIYVRFDSDDTIEYQGFLARYGFEIESKACIAASRPDVITRPTGLFSSPDWPDDYTNNLECQWHIIAPGVEDRISLEFFDFEVEGGCNAYDTLEVYDGPDQASPRIGRWYDRPNTMPPEIRSSTNEVFLRFKTDSSIVYRGFLGGWEFIDL